MPKTTWDSRQQEIRREHARIHAIIAKVEFELDHLLDPTQVGDARELRKLVESLSGHLKQHFELEEGGGLLGAAVEYYEPDMQKMVSDLIAEHREFEQRLERILEAVVIGRPVRSHLDGDMRQLIVDLQRHEADENALLARLLS